MVAPDTVRTGYDLADWRKAMGWTQVQAAAQLRVAVGTLRAWEGGRNMPAVVGLAAELLRSALVQRP